MKYSPISKIYIQDFRNLGNVAIDWTKSPIVVLTGENEAGKTSVIKAFTVLALHATPNAQSGYIRDGQKQFGVACDLADGTRIIRVKQRPGGFGTVNNYSITYPDGKKWAINKLSDGLPKPVSDLMGMIVEPDTGEYLQVRTYEDKLLFAVTPFSTNYKVMYNALKVEQLTKAIKLGSDEVNRLKREIESTETSILTLRDQAREIKVLDTETLVNIKDRLKDELNTLDKIEKLKSLIDNVDRAEDQLGALALIDKFGLRSIDEIHCLRVLNIAKALDNIKKAEDQLGSLKLITDNNLHGIDEMLASNLKNASRLIENSTKLKNKLSKVSAVSTIHEIDLSQLNQIEKVINKKAYIERKLSDSHGLALVNELQEISGTDMVRLDKLSNLYQLINNVKQKESKLKIIDTSEYKEISIDYLEKFDKIRNYLADSNEKQQTVNKIKDFLEQANNWLKQQGIAVETCPNCGETVIFDLDKLR